MINQRMIAEKAGVSYATVSRAFTHSAKVQPKTLLKIRNAMKELGIQNQDDVLVSFNPMSRMVLIVVANIISDFFGGLITRIHDNLIREGYTLSLCISNYNTETELQAVRSAENNHYAGIMMVTVVETPEMVAFLNNTKTPVILVSRHIRSLDIDVVRIDNYRGGYMAAQYLVENGHTHIAHLSGPKNSSAIQDRLRGFRDALQDLHIEFSDKDIMYGDLTRNSGSEFASFITTSSKYTCAFISNDYMAEGAAHQLSKLGYRVPDDFSIICFDDSMIINEEALNLTTISFSTEKMGDSATDLLLKRIREPLGDRVRLTYSPSLIIRNSVRNLK